jgi:predicted small lipoprotein YifL
MLGFPFFPDADTMRQLILAAALLAILAGCGTRGTLTLPPSATPGADGSSKPASGVAK